MMKKSKIFILYTGGTIGMALEDPSNYASPLVPKSLPELIEWVPGWQLSDGQQLKLANGIRLDFDSLDEPLDSSNVTPDHWLDMARRIKDVYDDYDAFVILHGTDTMAYTASGLAFIFENLSKPVIITGSQLPISDERTDAVMNLVNAVHIAGYQSTGLPCIPEVVICFADKILRGCRASKVSSNSWAGFDSPNFPALGYIGEHIRINENLLRPMPEKGQSFQLNTDLNTNVLDIALNPGIKASQLEHILKLDVIDAVLLRTFGAGNAPDKQAFLDVIEDSITRNKTIVNVTQCSQGMVEMGLYSASSGMLERGVISGLDMTPEAALAKLYVSLGTKIGSQVITQMQVSQRGEQSVNLFDLRYGHCANLAEGVQRFDHYITPDRRFKVSKMNRAVVRFKGLGVSGMGEGKTVSMRVFMNKPSARSETSSDDLHCVAQLSFTWKGEPINLTHVMDDARVKGSIGDGDVSLSVRSDEGVSFCFEGLYLALFSEA